MKFIRQAPIGRTRKRNPLAAARPNLSPANGNAAAAKARANPPTRHLRMEPRLRKSFLLQPRKPSLPPAHRNHANARVPAPSSHRIRHRAQKSIPLYSRKWRGKSIWPRSARKASPSSATMMRKISHAVVSGWLKSSLRNRPGDVRPSPFSSFSKRPADSVFPSSSSR